MWARTLAGCRAEAAVHFHPNTSKADWLVAEIEGVGRRASRHSDHSGSKDRGILLPRPF